MNEARFSAVDHALMARALRLAERGLWTADPNPRVGCVVAHDGHVVGEGWHQRTGEAHAETRALEQAGERARGATAYLTLEPCSHHGRTPPCTDALIDAGVASVVCAIGDPYPSVDGNGIRRLAEAGIDVRVGLMEAAARALNPGFLSRFERGRPYVRAKLAGSLDGRSSGADGESRWITAEPARRDGHRWRARAGAILTGIETVLADDPALDVRLTDFGKTPAVVVADSRGRLRADARLLSTGAPVLHATLAGSGTPRGCTRVELPDDGSGRVDPAALLADLARREVNELHVEAGPALTGALLAAGLVDEVLVYAADCLIGADGGPLVRLPGVEKFDQRLHFRTMERRAIGADWRTRLVPIE